MQGGQGHHAPTQRLKATIWPNIAMAVSFCVHAQLPFVPSSPKPGLVHHLQCQAKRQAAQVLSPTKPVSLLTQSTSSGSLATSASREKQGNGSCQSVRGKEGIKQATLFLKAEVTWAKEGPHRPKPQREGHHGPTKQGSLRGQGCIAKAEGPMLQTKALA